MALSHKLTLQFRNDAGTVVTDVATYSGPAEENASITALHSATKELDMAVDVSQIESFWIKSDKDLTLKTNSTGSPAQTIALTAGKAYWWNTGRTDSCPLTTDITKFYFVNAGSTAADDATVTLAFLLNIAP